MSGSCTQSATFQSTPSTRRETERSCTQSREVRNFNPLPPHGGRPMARTSPTVTADISIHSLHTEGDLLSRKKSTKSKHFNPLPPHGGRLCAIIIIRKEVIFQSTPSTRRETLFSIYASSFLDLFQSTPSTRRETFSGHLDPATFLDFNPLPPHGGRLVEWALGRDPTQISIHSLHTEGDLPTIPTTPQSNISIHSLHTEGDRVFLLLSPQILPFQSTPSTRRET